MTCSCGCIITRLVTQFIQNQKKHMPPLALHMTARDFLNGIDCTCLHGKQPCRKFPVMTILLFLSGSAPEIKMCDRTICSDDLLGMTQQDDGVVKGKYFNDWYIICTAKQTNHLLALCNPTVKQPGLECSTRKEKDDKANTKGYTMTFPDEGERRSPLCSPL